MMFSPLLKFDITWNPECLLDDDDDDDDKDNVNDNEDVSMAELWFKFKSAILDELDIGTTTGTGRTNTDEPL